MGRQGGAKEVRRGGTPIPNTSLVGRIGHAIGAKLAGTYIVAGVRIVLNAKGRIGTNIVLVSNVLVDPVVCDGCAWRQWLVVGTRG